MGLWVGKKFTFLGLDYYWGTQIGGQKGKGPKMPKTPAQAAVLVIGLLISVALSCWLVDALFNPDSGLNEAERLEKALRQVDRPAGYRLDALTVQEAETTLDLDRTRSPLREDQTCHRNRSRLRPR